MKGAKMKEKKKKDPKKKKRVLIITGSILGVFALFVITVVMITIIGDKANIKRAESYDPVVIENQLVPEKDENGYWTFTTDRDLKIMQLTDIHLGGGWLSLKKDSQAINAVATMIQAVLHAAAIQPQSARQRNSGSHGASRGLLDGRLRQP